MNEGDAMTAKELSSERRGREGEVDVGEAALTMAIGIVIERVSRLSDADRSDLFELVKGLADVKDREDFESVRAAMLEILDQECVTAHEMTAAAVPSSDKLGKWKEYVGRQVCELRKKKGMTQDDLAKATGLPQSHVSRIERATLSPSHATVERIAKALGVAAGAIDPSR
jgi:DNA-binding XRE family transcriptional regulator